MVQKKAEVVNGTIEEQVVVENSAENTEKTEDRVLPSTCEVDAIIRKRVYAAIGIGFVPVPLVDLVGITAVQLEMIHALAKAYNVEFKKERVKSILSSLCGSVVTVAAVPVLASLFKSIPVIGSTTGAATISITGGATTYAVGWVFDRHFRKGGNLVNFDTQEAKEYFKTKMSEGKSLVSKMKSKTKKDASEVVPDGDATPAT